jgi:hypothetical protein
METYMPKEQTTVTLDDGTIFEVEAVRLPGDVKDSLAVVVNDEIRGKAKGLLPAAQAMAESRVSHLSFFRASGKSLELDDGEMHRKAKIRANESLERVQLLFMLAQGRSFDEARVVTVATWCELLTFFNHKTDVGSVPRIRG